VKRALVVALVALPASAHAQETQRCFWQASGGQRVIEVAPGVRNIYLSRNVVLRCPDRSIRITSDSLESYEGEGRVFLIGNVHYTEPRLGVDSDFLTYYQRDERVVANGNVTARLPNGSTLVGPIAEYLRATPSTRPVERMFASGRPTITLVQRDSAGQPSPPTTVLANAITTVGDSLVYAGGQVVVTREDVIARGDSMALDSEREFTRMMRGPSIEGRRDRPYRLSGTIIELTGADRKLSRVLSMGEARATSEDLILTSDTIDLRVADDLLQRAVAWGPARARAHSPTQELIADSIDVSMPEQRVREIDAVRGAAAHGRPDSTRFRADTVDWMRGDTIIARFDTTIVDTTRLKELHAIGNARSYYHLAPADTSLDRPAINYVTGREIVIDFQEQRVTKVNVVEQASGVYLEPTPVAANDTSRAAPGASPARATPAAGAPRPQSQRPASPAPVSPTPTRAPVRRPAAR
jgi:lipopolysaccharide export system protein LptA